MKSKTKTVQIPKSINPVCCYKDIELDSALPDFSPDISRLVRIDATPYVENLKCEEKCEIKGKLVFGLLYESDYKSKLSYVTFTSDVVQKCDIGTFSSCFPEAKMCCTYLTCRLLGQRRFSIKAKIETTVCGTTINDFTVAETENGDLNTFFKTADIPVLMPSGEYKNEFDFKQFAKSDKPITAVIYSNATISPPETAISEKAANIKANITVKTLCELEGNENEYSLFTNTFPVEINMNGDLITENSLVNTSLLITELSVIPDLDEYGENKIMNIKYIIKANALSREKAFLTVAADGFCGKNECECEYSSLSYDEPCQSAEKNIIFEKTFSSDGNMLEKIIDTQTDLVVTSKTVKDGMLNLKIKAKSDVLAKSDGSILSLSFSDDFEESLPFDSAAAVGDISIFPFEVSSTLYGNDSVSIRVMAFVKASGNVKTSQSTLSTLNIGDSFANSESGFVIYYPDADEDAWEVAKKYHTSPKKLLDGNRDIFDVSGKLKSGKRFVRV
ncbi:MAG: DUF3794 domain-containing protein [Clostridia bacterium]